MMPRTPSVGRFASELGRKIEHARPDNPYYPVPWRLTLLGQLLHTLAALHEHGVVMGDVQPRNILVSRPGREPAIFLVDIDAVCLRGQTATPPMTPDTWKVPGEELGFTKGTDLRKFAALAVRVLHEDMAGSADPDERLLRRGVKLGHLRLLQQMAHGADLRDEQVRYLANDWMRCVRYHPAGASGRAPRTFLWNHEGHRIMVADVASLARRPDDARPSPAFSPSSLINRAESEKPKGSSSPSSRGSGSSRTAPSPQVQKPRMRTRLVVGAASLVTLATAVLVYFQFPL